MKNKQGSLSNNVIALRMKRFLITLMLAFMGTSIQVFAQQLKTINWETYGLRFKAPTEVKTEADDEEQFAAIGPHYEISIQMLESDGMKKEELADDLLQIATEDSLTDISPVSSKVLNKQLNIVFLKAKLDGRPCLYAYMLAKDGSCAFFLTILYVQATDKVPESLLPTFQLTD